MKKRLAMLVLAGAMVTSSLTGCGLKDSATVATVAGDEIPAGLANFYARMTQAQYERVCIPAIWEIICGRRKHPKARLMRSL